MGKKKKTNDLPFAYHTELEFEVTTLTNLGSGLGRVALPGETDAKWVVMVPFTLPGERVRARVFRNHKNFSEADLIAVLTPSADRVAPGCPLFGRCGGCQYQHLAYAEQLLWKQRQVAELLQHMAGIEFAVAPVVPSPCEYGYRSKITPHFAPPRRFALRGSECCVPGSELLEDHSPTALSTLPDSEPGTRNAALGTQTAGSAAFPIGFLRQGTRFDIVDVPRCPIATDAINTRLAEVRAEVQARRETYSRGATLLLREASGAVTTDYDAVITETIAPVASDANIEPRTSNAEHRTAGPVPSVHARNSAASASAPSTFNVQRSMFDVQPSPSAIPAAALAAPLKLRFLARDFFQNNPFILPAFTGYVRAQAAASGARFLVDAYCGSGLFALTAAPYFEQVAGVEISESSVKFARENAAANGIANATFLAADAAQIFAGLPAQAPAFAAADTVVVIDPPRKGCDRQFLAQLFAFGPRAVVYVSCDPATQMRDLKEFLAAGYTLTAAQPFDLFPQTRHLECVLTLVRADRG